MTVSAFQGKDRGRRTWRRPSGAATPEVHALSFSLPQASCARSASAAALRLFRRFLLFLQVLRSPAGALLKPSTKRAAALSPSQVRPHLARSLSHLSSVPALQAKTLITPSLPAAAGLLLPDGLHPACPRDPPRGARPRAPQRSRRAQAAPARHYRRRPRRCRSRLQPGRQTPAWFSMR